MLPLHQVAKDGSLEKVVQLLQQGYDVNEQDEINCSPAHYGAVQGHLEIVEHLVESGAHVDEPLTTRGPPTPVPLLCLAAAQGHLNVVHYLISAGAEVNVRCECNVTWGLTPLILAATHNHSKIMELLLQAGAYPESWCSDIEMRYSTDGSNLLETLYPMFYVPSTPLTIHIGLTHFNPSDLRPLCIAADRGNEDAVTLLIKYGADVNKHTDGYTLRYPIHFAAMKGHSRTVNILLEAGADVNSGGLLDIEQVDELVNKDKDWITPLHLAAHNGHEETVNILLDAGANWELPCIYSLVSVPWKTRTEGLLPVHLASINGHVPIIRRLLELHSDVDVDVEDAYGHTPLMLAALYGRKDAIEFLLQAGAAIDVVCDHQLDGNSQVMDENVTALHLAAISGCVESAKVLVAAGASVHERSLRILPMDDQGDEVQVIEANTPLHLAAMKNNVDMIIYLIAAGAEVNVNNIDSTPLLLACLHSTTDACKVLLQAGADPNARDSTGKNPLHLSIIYNSKGDTLADRITLLVGAGTAINAQDNHGDTPLHKAIWARTRYQPIDCLLEAGADPCIKNKPILVQNPPRHKPGETPLQMLFRDYRYSRSQRPVATVIDQQRRNRELGAFYNAVRNLVAAGDRNWRILPVPCWGLQRILGPIWENAPQDLPQFYAHLVPRYKNVIKEALRVLHRYLPGHSVLQMSILSKALEKRKRK